MASRRSLLSKSEQSVATTHCFSYTLKVTSPVLQSIFAAFLMTCQLSVVMNSKQKYTKSSSGLSDGTSFHLVTSGKMRSAKEITDLSSAGTTGTKQSLTASSAYSPSLMTSPSTFFLLLLSDVPWLSSCEQACPAPCQQLFSSLQKVQIDKQDSLKKINAFIVFYSLYSI